MSLVPLREACDARDDILQGGLDGNHFAAQLDKVVRDAANYPIYGDADEFFAITYPTGGLHALLTRTFGRVTRAKGVAGENGVLRPTTSFGGGKTHDLVAIYHLAKGARPEGLDAFMDTSVLPASSVQVAALVADSQDPAAGLMVNGHRTYTWWGGMAAQLGEAAYTAMKVNDESRSAPGTQTILDAFGGRPTIVIVDEIAQYLRQLTSSGDEDVRRMAQAMPVFLKNLFEIASDASNRVCVIITLAASANAFGKETDELTELLDEATEATSAALTEAKDVLARSISPSAVIRPADDSEIGEILKRRLFKSIDPAAAKAAADAYKNLYQNLSTTEDLAGGAEHPDQYAEQIEKYYPLHPELVRVLDKRLGDIPQFQRARGALKLLAEVVHHVYVDGDNTAVINVGDIDYSDQPVLSHLTEGLGRGEFENVATADFAGPTSHAAALDAKLFPGRSPYTTRVAQTVFTHSLEMKAGAGASRNDWLLGTIRPGEDPAVFEKALIEAEKVFWHLSYDGSRFRFNVEPNVNAIIETEKRNVQNTQVAALLDDHIATAFSNDGGATTVLFPTGPAGIHDQASLRVAVIHHDQVTVNATTADTPPGLLQEILAKTGSSGSLRRFKNSIVFAVADENQVEALKDRIRGTIAADTLAADSARMAQFGPEIHKRITAFQKSAALEARVAITRCYKHVYYPVGDKTTGFLRHHELPPQQQGETKTATRAVLTLLEDENKIRTNPMTSSFLKSKTWPSGQESVTTQAMLDWFWMDHSSPMVRDTNLIREAVTNGIRNDGWVYYDASTGKVHTGTTMQGLKVEFRPDVELMSTGEATNRNLLVRKPTIADLNTVLPQSVTTGASIRAALEVKCGGEPPKAEVLDVLANAVQAGQYETIVVTDTDPIAGDVPALTPSSIRDKGLDALHVMPRTVADKHGVVIPKRIVTGKTFNAAGAGGIAIQQITDQITDFTIQTITKATIRVSADNTRGTGDIDLAVIALGMLPKHQITITVDLAAEYDGLTGGAMLKGAAERSKFQSIYNQVGKALKAAKVVDGSLTLQVVFAPAVDVTDGAWSQLHKVIKELGIQHVDITADVAK